MRRPFHVAAVAGTAAHHLFELGAGLGLIFAPQLGMRGAGVFWGSLLPASGLAAARGSERWARPLAYATGTSLAMDLLHYRIWPWEARRGIPTLTDAEGLGGRALAAYNGVLQAWAAAAALALAVETPRGAHRFAALGAVVAMAVGRPSVNEHFRWLEQSARSQPAWWNRAGASDPLRRWRRV